MSAPVSPSLPSSGSFETVSLEQLSPDQVELTRLGSKKLTLCLILPGGKKVPIPHEELTDEEKRQLSEMEGKLLEGGGIDVSLNLDECTCQRDGVTEYYTSSHPLIAEGRKLAQKILKNNSSFHKQFYAGDCSFEGKREAPKSPRLANLEYQDDDLASQIRFSQKPIDEKKRLVLKREAARLLRAQSSAILNTLQEQLPRGELASQSKAREIQSSQEIIQSLNGFEIDFELTHSAEPTREGVESKKKQALDLIQGREAPKKMLGLKKDVDEEEEGKYAAKLALNSCRDRASYEKMCREMQVEPEAVPLESFYISLTEAVCEGRDVESILQSRAFERIFGSLDSSQQEIVRDSLSQFSTTLTEKINEIAGSDKPVYRTDIRAWPNIQDASMLIAHLRKDLEHRLTS